MHKPTALKDASFHSAELKQNESVLVAKQQREAEAEKIWKEQVVFTSLPRQGRKILL